MKIDRLVSIIMLLLEKGRIGAKELADMFEVSLRTIYRDIDTINMAGIPIRSTSGVGGGFEIMENYKIDKKIFTMNDLSAILMGLSNLSSSLHEDEVINALAKVKSFIPADKSSDVELKANQIFIDLSPWVGNKNIQPYLEKIKTALQENKLLSFEYADRHGNKTARKAEPYQLVLKNSHWYLRGYCLTRNDFRLFKLTRMSSLRIENETFAQRAYEKSQFNFDDAPDETQTIIKIKIHKSVMDRALDYCTYEQLIPDGEEYYVVDFPFVENDYYYNKFFSLGDKCECLGPPRIRKEMLKRIQKLEAMYKDD